MVRSCSEEEEGVGSNSDSPSQGDDGKRIEHNQNQNLYNPHNTNRHRHRPGGDICGMPHYAKGTGSAYLTPNDPSLHMTVVNPPSPMSVSVGGSRKRSYVAISSGSQVDVESLTDRVACQLVRLEECGAIDCDMLDKACMAYDRFLREDLPLHVKVFLHAKTVANKLKRLERDLKMYDQMLKNDQIG